MGDDERDDLVGDEEGHGQSQAASGAGKSVILKILIFVGGGILLVIMITGISYLVSKSVQVSSYETRQDIVSAPPPPPLQTFELPAFSKTTADLEPHFLKMTVSLGFDTNMELSSELIRRRDEFLHIINLILQGKVYEDLNSTSGALDLAEEIKANINVRLASGKIKEVYYKEFVLN
jgi:flagellar basal body-associated protein FliL